MNPRAVDRVAPSSGLCQQGDLWVMWCVDDDGVQHTSHPMPYPLAREELTERRKRAAMTWCHTPEMPRQHAGLRGETDQGEE